MKKELSIDAFGEIVDEFLKENEIHMTITLPEGSVTPVIKDNIGTVSVLQFYILLNTVGVVVKQVVKDMNIDTATPEWEKTVVALLHMVKQDIMDADSESKEERA